MHLSLHNNSRMETSRPDARPMAARRTVPSDSRM